MHWLPRCQRHEAARQTSDTHMSQVLSSMKYCRCYCTSNSRLNPAQRSLEREDSATTAGSTDRTGTSPLVLLLAHHGAYRHCHLDHSDSTDSVGHLSL